MNLKMLFPIIIIFSPLINDGENAMVPGIEYFVPIKETYNCDKYVNVSGITIVIESSKETGERKSY